MAEWDKQDKNDANSGMTLLVSIAVAVIPTVMVSYLISEKSKGLKHIQTVSGMNLWSYWMGNMLMDLIKVLLLFIVILILALIAGVNYKEKIILFVLFPLALVPFTYATTFLFKNDTMAQIFTLILHLVVGCLFGGLEIVTVT